MTTSRPIRLYNCPDYVYSVKYLQFSRGGIPMFAYSIPDLNIDGEVQAENIMDAEKRIKFAMDMVLKAKFKHELKEYLHS